MSAKPLRCECATTEAASPRRSWTSSSNRFSAPSQPARAQGSDCRSAMKSSPNSIAGRSRSPALSESSPNSRYVCRAASAPKGRRILRRELGIMSVSILIVDDEPDVAILFRQQFRREAREGVYVLHFALSASEALERLAGEIEPQLIVILSDINMPGMDGLALLREIKTRRPELPVMMLTAYGDDERRRRAAEGGAADFVTKPVDFDFLKIRLRELHGPLV